MPLYLQVADISSPEGKKAFEAEMNVKVANLHECSKKLTALRKKVAKRDVDAWSEQLQTIDEKLQDATVVTRLCKNMLQDGKAPAR